MSASIVPQLVKKDFRLISGILLGFVVVSIVFIGILSLMFGHAPFAVLANLGFILLIGPAATCGIVMLMKTNVLEKEKSTQPFIMSLPITVKEFTQAKLLLNLPVFSAFWLAISVAAFYFAFGRGLLPLGAVPFVTMVFLGGFVAYNLILATSLLTQSLPITVLCIALFEVGTSAYLWTIVFFPPVGSYVLGPQAVWNTQAIAIVAAQAMVAILVPLLTLAIQNTKRDFI